MSGGHQAWLCCQGRARASCPVWRRLRRARVGEGRSATPAQGVASSPSWFHAPTRPPGSPKLPECTRGCPRLGHVPPTRFRSSEPAWGRCPCEAGRTLSERSQPGSLLLRSGLLWDGGGRRGRVREMECPGPKMLSCPAERATTRGRQVAEVGVGVSKRGGHNSITYRRWAGQGAEQGALEAWGCPALPAFAGRFARRSCCEVCGGSTGVRGGGQGGAEVTGLGPALPEREPGRLPSAPRPTGSLGCRPPRPGRYLARTAWAGRAPRAPLVLRAVAMEEVLCGTCGRREGSVLRPHGHPDGEANGQAGGL